MTGVTVAAVQAPSECGAVEQNLTEAGRLVSQAAAAGADLIVCPEFLAPGYEYDERIWHRAEPVGGQTETWLATLAAEHSVHVGAGFLEADGDQFYNTFSLFGPNGKLAGRIRKGSLPVCEGWYFAPSPEPKMIDTELGRIGVGICNDNHTAWFFRHVAEQQPDLLLMPHSAPIPRLPLLSGSMREQLTEIGAFYAREFGIPVVFANKASTGRTWIGLPVVPFLRLPLSFEGGSAIYAAGGRVVARRSDAAADIVTGRVELDPARKRRPETLPSGYWAREPNRLPGAAGRAQDLLASLGQCTYTANPRRAKAARSISETIDV